MWSLRSGAMRANLTKDEYDALPEVLTPEQVALIINNSRRQVIALAAAGQLPGTQIGRDWRFSKSRLEAFLDGAD